MPQKLKPKFLMVAHTVAACLSLTFCSSSASGADITASIPTGLNMFYASHSLMWDVPEPFAEMAKAYGITNHSIAIQRMGFSRTQQFWNQPEGQSQAKQALKTGNIDDFVMSPMDMSDTGVAEFVKLGILNNPHNTTNCLIEKGNHYDKENIT